MNPVGLILNVFLCCIVNIHVRYKYEIDLIATDKCYCDVTFYFCGPKGWMNVYMEGLGTRSVAVSSIGRV